jgi:tetratricopeptide (TPR) repeat protein
MRSPILALFALLTVAAQAQTLSFPEWQLRSEQDPLLKPRSTAYQNTEALRDEVVALSRTLRSKGLSVKQASDSVVAMGFEALLKSDHVKAMRLFNQAYAIMPENSEAYRGFGGVFESMERPLEAHDQFRAGLALDTTNAKLFRDEALLLMEDRYAFLQDERPRQADQCLDGAYKLFNKAYAIDPDDNTTTYYLFVTNLLRMNCVKAWEFHDRAVAQNGRSIEEQYRLMLNESCKR